MKDKEVLAAAQSNGWEIEYMEGGAAYVTRAGTEIHFKVTDGCEHRAIQRNRIRKFAQQLLAKHEMLTTRVNAGDKINQRFVEVMGFEKTHSDETYDYFMMTALPFER